jgi:hypothetical protein
MLILVPIVLIVIIVAIIAVVAVLKRAAGGNGRRPPQVEPPQYIPPDVSQLEILRLL